MTFNQTNTGGGSASPLTGTFSGGVANVTITGIDVGLVTLNAVGDGFTSSTTTSFTVTVGSASKVVLSGNCSGNIVSGSGCVATATIEDANGNTVNYGGGAAFNQTNTGGGLASPLTGTFSGGVANVTITGIKVGLVTLNAVGDGFTSSTTTSFTVTAGLPTQLAITSTPINSPHGTTRNPFTITLEDVNGNATTSASAITIKLAVTPTSGTSFYATTTGGAVTTVTLAANNSAVTAYLEDTTAR